MPSRVILIMGTGRCGSTIFYKMVASHPELAFIPAIDNWFPKLKYVSALTSEAWKLGLKRGMGPSEAYPLLDSLLPGYSLSYRSLAASDVSTRVKVDFRRLFGDYMKYQHKKRICYKYTGWSRIGFFNEIFPDALFIHIVRDGRAVAYSLLNVPWWHGWQGPWNWRWGELPEKYKKEWEESGRSFVVLAGIEWKMLLDEIEESRKILKEDRFLQIRYEDFVERPLAIMKDVTNFAGLTFSRRFRKRVMSYELRNTNYRWSKELPVSERMLLNRSLERHLRKLGYEVD